MDSDVFLHRRTACAEVASYLAIYVAKGSADVAMACASMAGCRERV